MTLYGLFTMLAFAFAGAIFGVVYLGLLYLSVQTLTHRNAVATFVMLAILRAALLLVVLGGALTFKINAVAMLAALAGFIVARIASTQVSSAKNVEGFLCR